MHILGVQYTTHVFLTWRVRARVSVIARLSNPGLICINKQVKTVDYYFAFFWSNNRK